MNVRYKVISTGQLSHDAEKKIVIENLSKMFRIPSEKAEKLISSQKPRIIKRDLSQDIAEKYKRKLSEAGLITNIIVDDINCEKTSPIKENSTQKTFQQKTSCKTETNTTDDLAQSIYKSPNSILKEEPIDQMGFAGLLGRFTMWYLTSMILIGIVLYLLGLKGNSGSAVAIIIVSVMLACTSFAKKNERYLSNTERIKATIGFSFINIFFQCSFSALLFIGLSKPITPKVIFTVVSIPLLVHTPLIYFSIWSNKRRMIKRGEINV